MQRQIIGGDGGRHLAVIGRLDNDDHSRRVLGRRSQQRHPADVDLFQGFLQRVLRLRNGIGERVEIDHHQIDCGDAVGLQFAHLAAVVAARQDSPGDLRVQRLDPAAEHLRRPRMVRNLGHRQAGVGERGGGAAVESSSMP